MSKVKNLYVLSFVLLLCHVDPLFCMSVSGASEGKGEAKTDEKLGEDNLLQKIQGIVQARVSRWVSVNPKDFLFSSLDSTRTDLVTINMDAKTVGINLGLIQDCDLFMWTGQYIASCMLIKTNRWCGGDQENQHIWINVVRELLPSEPRQILNRIMYLMVSILEHGSSDDKVLELKTILQEVHVGAHSYSTLVSLRTDETLCSVKVTLRSESGQDREYSKTRTLNLKHSTHYRSRFDAIMRIIEETKPKDTGTIINAIINLFKR